MLGLTFRQSVNFRLDKKLKSPSDSPFLLGVSFISCLTERVFKTSDG